MKFVIISLAIKIIILFAIKTFKTYKKNSKKEDKTCWWQSTQCQLEFNENQLNYM